MLAGNATEIPTTVQARDGSTFIIPGGAPGSAAWARQASLIAAAYRMAGDAVNADKWQREYGKRLSAWNAVEAGADAKMVIDAGSWIDGPARIYAAAADTIEKIRQELLKLAAKPNQLLNWLPVIAVLGILTVAVGFNRGSLSVRR